MNYDILIMSGIVLDGRGQEGTIADIGIRGDRIAGIGNLKDSTAPIRIDAAGKYVTPGFIDITNHADTHLSLFKYPTFDSALMQGVTTVMGGNCGASLAPLASHEALGAIRKWADYSDININWTTFEEFLSQLEAIRLGVNMGSFVGYSTLRRGVIHDAIRLLTFEERERVRLLLGESIKQGAYGLSMGLSYGHERISTTEELIDICRIMEGSGTLLKVHLRSEGIGLLASVNEAIRIGRETGISVQISHLKAIGKKAWPSLRKALELIEHANQSGADVNFDVSPYHTTGSLLYLLVPAWAREGGIDELFRHIDNPEDHKKILDELGSYTLHGERILITSAKVKSIVGRTLAQIAAQGGMSQEEALIDTIRANEGRVSIVGRTVSRKNTVLAIQDQRALVASDGPSVSQEEVSSGNLIHPRAFGAFPHFWHRFVNDLKLLRPEVAIQKIASGPARKLGLDKRGTIERNHFADIVIFDPQLIRDRSTYQDPFHYPAGINWVIVNGKVAVEEGRLLGVRAGMILRKGV